jgi:hypothetical protein
MRLRVPFAPLAAAGAVPLAAAGAVLLTASAAAAQTAPPPAVPAPLLAQELPPPPAPPRYRSNSMRIAGIVLTSIGSAALVSGVAVIAADLSGGGEFAGIVSVYFGLPLVGLSTILAGVGVSLWVVGARPPKPGPGVAAPASLVPTVSPGPRGVALRWAF